DDPAIALALGAGADHAGVGAAARRRLGHGEGRAHLALDDRPQPLLLLRRRADAREQVHVAVVGGRTVEAYRAEDGAVRLFVHGGPADHRQAHATELLRRLRRPQAGFLRLRAHVREQVEPDVLVAIVVVAVRLERQHVLLDEGAGAPADVLDLGREREVHDPCLSTLRQRTRTSIVWRGDTRGKDHRHDELYAGIGCDRRAAGRG